MAQIDSLPPLRDVIAKHGLGALKALGQNFLLDLNLTSRIARAGGSLEGATVVEVGPGPGGLTRAILAAGVAKLIVVERDRRAIPALQEIAEAYPGKLTIVEGDALKEDLAALAGGPAHIIANLPYNIATPLLIGWLKSDPWPPWWISATLMFQKEVAERIVATPEDNAFGRLGVLARWKTEPRILFEVSPKAFVPPPKVTSAIVHLVPRPTLEACDADILERTVAAAFGQRRKMLRSSLKSMSREADAWLIRAGIDPTARAETVDVAGFIRLANAYQG